MYNVWMYMRFKKSSFGTYIPFYNKFVDHKEAIVFTSVFGLWKGGDAKQNYAVPKANF